MHALPPNVLDAIETTPRHSFLNLPTPVIFIHHLSELLQPEGRELLSRA